MNNKHGKKEATRLLLGLPFLINQKSIGLSLSAGFSFEELTGSVVGGMDGRSAPHNRGEPDHARLTCTCGLPARHRWGPRFCKVRAGPEAAAHLLPITPALCVLGRPHVTETPRAGPEARASQIPFPPPGCRFRHRSGKLRLLIPFLPLRNRDGVNVYLETHEKRAVSIYGT